LKYKNCTSLLGGKEWAGKWEVKGWTGDELRKETKKEEEEEKKRWCWQQ